MMLDWRGAIQAAKEWTASKPASGARSRELDRLIKQDEKRMSKEVKLLLLGTQVAKRWMRIDTRSLHRCCMRAATLSLECSAS